jgi:hypothetical protein
MRSLGFVVEKLELSSIIHSGGIPKPAFRKRHAHLPPHQQPQYHASQLLLPRIEFLKVAARKIVERDPATEVERAMALFDPDERGYIEYEDVRRVGHDLGETGLTEDEIHAMIDEFDYDGTGSVAKEAFYAICLQ